MVKMAYPSSLPGSTSMSSIELVTKAWHNIPQLENNVAIKRLCAQNIIVKRIPVLSKMENKDNFGDKKNGMNTTLKSMKASEISIVPLMIPDEENEDANLLPSKTEDKKSEIALFPIKKKRCGHYEPCEYIVCDVMVQQYAEKDGTSPMLAVNIEEDEINAPVAKHCKNKYCDALSIDHNRCRRVLIKLYRCDKSYKCDICEIMLKNWKSRFRHKDCTRKDEYIHNNVNRRDLLRERMRERELQILEIVKMKRNDYSDPAKVIETLQNNDELIVIPKTAPSQQPVITITSIPSVQSTGSNLSKVQPIKINSFQNNVTNLFGNMSFTVASQNIINRGTSYPMDNKIQSVQINQIKLPNLQQKTYMTSTPAATSGPVVIPASAVIPVSTSTPTSTTTPAPSSIPVRTTIPISIPVASQQNKYIRLTTPAQSNTTSGQSLTGWIVSPTQTPTTVLSTTPIQLKPILTPIRVMPITKLITAPSLLHRTQGLPKFCIMTLQNSTSGQQPSAVTVNLVSQENTNTKKNETPQVQPQNVKSHIGSSTTQQDGVKIEELHKKKKKVFSCPYCEKHFTTDWYYKMHVAKHQKMFSCNFCEQFFKTSYDKKKHIEMFHSNQATCQKCDYVYKSQVDMLNHMKTCMRLVSESVKSTKRKLQEKDINSTTDDITEKCMKKIKFKDIPDSPSKNKEVSINDEKTTQCNESLKSTGINECDKKELLTIEKDDNISVNGFAFVSVEENIDSENFEQEIVVSC